jgi:hypothetical protein
MGKELFNPFREKVDINMWIMVVLFSAHIWSASPSAAAVTLGQTDLMYYSEEDCIKASQWFKTKPTDYFLEAYCIPIGARVNRFPDPLEHK